MTEVCRLGVRENLVKVRVAGSQFSVAVSRFGIVRSTSSADHGRRVHLTTFPCFPFLFLSSELMVDKPINGFEEERVRRVLVVMGSRCETSNGLRIGFAVRFFAG